MTRPERLVVGVIVKPHGIAGEVAVADPSDAPGRFDPGSVVYGRDDAVLTVRSARPHQGRMLVRFEEVPDRNAAELLRGVELTVPAETAPPLPEGLYYAFDLVGCRVVDEDGAALGEMARVDESPAGDLWVVRTERGEVLVPAVREIVREVDLDDRRIVLSPPEGLFG